MTSVSKSSAEGALFRQSLHEGVLHHVTYMEFLRKMLDSIHILRLRRTISLALSLILSRDLCVPHCLSSCRDLSLQSRLAISLVSSRDLCVPHCHAISLVSSRDLSPVSSRDLCVPHCLAHCLPNLRLNKLTTKTAGRVQRQTS